jgi:hypothetical protein
MAQTGFTPIQLYSSSTPTNAPSAGNLTNDTKGSELAINIADKNLFFKDSTNAVNTVPIRQSSTSSNGWLSSTDWNTFNNKQPAGTYVTSVTGTAPVVSSGGTTPAISMAAATTSVNGYLTSTDWNTFNNKQAALVSGTNIKTVNGTTLLGSGDLGTIGVGYGGTGLTSLTAGYIPYGNGTSAFSSNNNLTFDGTNLTVGSNAPPFGSLNVQRYASAPYATLTIGDYATPTNGVGIYFRTTSTPAAISTGGSPLVFQGGTGGPEWVRMFASGGVSIGNTTDPGAGNLSVNGNGRFATTSSPGSGTVTIKGNGSDEVISCVGYSTNGSGQILFYQPSVGVKWGIYTDKDTFYIANAGFTNYAYLPQSFSAWSFASDRRIKKDIVDIEYGLETVMQLKPKRYTLIDKNVANIGFIAQELQTVVPEAVTGEEIEYSENDTPQEKAAKTMGVSKETLIPVLVKAIQELKQEFDAYRATHP